MGKVIVKIKLTNLKNTFLEADDRGIHHEGHEEHEVKNKNCNLLFFFLSSCSSCPSW
jgi:hypothetical protein